MNKRSLGILGEEAAAEFVEKKGWRVLERNWRKPWGELDLICENELGLLVFTEVKAEKVRSGFIPEQHVDERKQNRLRRLVLKYIFEHPKLRNRSFRIDVIAVDFSGAGEVSAIRHHEGVVHA